MSHPVPDELDDALEPSLAAPPAASDGVATRKIHLGRPSRRNAAAASPQVTALPAGDGLRWAPGSLLGDYELLAELGRGAMGIVYKARHRPLNRMVALKVTRAPRGLSTGETAQRFQAEAAAVARLDHPHIVPVYEVGEADGYPFFAMAFVEGSTLYQAVARGPLPQRHAAELTCRVAEAIAYAHAQGVIHRDLKPDNILLDRNGRPRITDFGIAKCQDAKRPMTLHGEILGTPGYMAPEQAQLGGPDRVGPHSDVYAIGATLYCLLTGRPPFQSANALDTLRQVLECDPVSPRELNAAVDRDLETLCLKCLETRPERRYPSARALADDLQRFLDHRPIHARPVHTADKAVRWCRRNPLAATLLAGTAVIFLAAYLVVSWSSWNAKGARDEALRHEKAERWERYRANLATVSSAQASHFVSTVRRVLESAPAEHRNWEWHHFRSQLDGSQRVWTVDASGTLNPVFLGNDTVVLATDRLRRLQFGAGTPRETPPFAMTHDQARFELSEDGRWLFHTTGDTALGIWDVAAARPRSRIAGAVDWFNATAFSPDGARLYALSADRRRLRTWDTATGHLLQTSPVLATPVVPMGASLSGRYCLLNCPDDTAHLFDVASGQKLHVLRGPFRHLTCVAFNRQGTRILSSEPYPSNVLRLWDAQTGKEVAVLKGHRNEAAPVAFSPDGSRIASCSFDRTVRLWDGTTGAPIAVLQGHNGRVHAVAFRPDSRRLVSASEDGTVRLWDAETGEALAVLEGHSGSVIRVSYSPNGRFIASGAHDRTIRLWDGDRAERNGVLRGHASYVYGAAFHPDGQRIVSASWDGTVRVWHASTAVEAARFDLAGSPIVTAVAVHPGGRLVAARARDNSVRLLDLVDRTEVYRWTIPTDNFVDSRLAFSPRGDLLAAGSNDGAVHVWETASRKVVAVLRGSRDTVLDLAFSPDGRWLATAIVGARPAIRIWDVHQATEIRSLQGHRSAVHSLAVSTDGKILASASQDGTACLWDTATWKERGQMKHGTAVYGLAFTPDGTRLAAACADAVIRLWDVATCQDVAELRGHHDYVYTLAFSPDGTRLVSGSGDFTLRIWDTLPPTERVPTDER